MINEYILQRYSDNRESTLGILLRKGATKLTFMAYTLEDEAQVVKVNGETRIPAGRYELVINRADTKLTLKYRQKYPLWFKYHIMLKDVPHFTGVYIHIGNNDDNTDACILVGDSANNNNLSDGEIRSSTQAFTRIYSELYGHLDQTEGTGRNLHYPHTAFLTIKDEKSLTL